MAADCCVFNVLGGGDVAVNKDAGFLAGIVPDQDGLDETVGVLDLRCSAFHRHKAAEEALVFELCSGDGLRRGHLALTELGDACHSDLALALIGGGGAGDANLVADLKVACNREGIDAGGFILQVDAVKERSVLVIAGGVGGHDALDGELDALVRLFLNGLDRGDLGRIEHCQQVFADAVVGVVLLCGVIDLCLNLKVRHEGRAGDDDLTLARELLGRHDHQAVVALCIGVLRNAGAAAAVVVNVHGVGRCVAVDHGADRCGHCGGRLALFIDRVDGRAAVVAEAFGVELVERMLRVKDHTLQQRVVHVVGREVESPLVNAVGCGANIVIGRVVGDAETRAERRQNVVLRLRHVFDGRVVLNGGVVLIVVRPAGEDHRAAHFVEGLDGGELCLGVGLGVLLRCLKAAGGCGQNERLVLRVAAGRDQLLTGVELHRAHGILRGEVSEVAHGILVVARNILVVMRGVDADVDELARVEDIERDVLGEGVILALERQDCRDGDRHHAGSLRRVPEGDGRRAGGRNRCSAALGALKLLAVYGVGDGLDDRVGVLTVKERRGDGQLLVGDRRCRAADCGGDAELERFADPDRRGHGDVAVALRDADEVVAVLGSQLHADSAVCKLRGIVPLISDLAGVDDQLDLLDGIGGIGIIEGNGEVQLLGNLGDDGAERQVVDGVADLEVLVLGGVDAHVAHGLIDALLREIIGQNDVTGVVGVAPAALVVILVVGRSEVPALVQRLDVLAVARVIAARADLAFAVADLDQIHTGVNDGIPVGKVLEGAEGRARMVELADGACALGLRQKRIIGLHARVVGLAVEGLVVAGDDAGGVEGVDVAGAAGPRHLKARDGDHAAGHFRVERFDRTLVGGPCVLAVGRGLGHVIERFLGVGLAGLVKVVGVVGERDKVNVRARRQIGNILQRAFQRARAVGILRVGVELAEVEAALGLTDGEAPSLFRRLFVGALDRHGHGDLAVCHVGSRGVGDLAGLIDRVDLLTVDGHGHDGVLAGVCDLGGDRRALVFLCLSALCGGDVRDDRLVLDGDLDRAGEGRVFRILGADSHIERLAGDLLAGDDDGVGAVRKRRDIFFTVHGDLGHTLHAERRINGERQRILCVLEGVLRRAEHDLRVVDNALVNLHVLRHGIEEEGVDGVVRDVVHAVGLEGIGVVFQPLAVAAVKLRRAMLHLKAAHAAGAGAHEPVGVLSLDGIIKCLAVEGVVAGAVGAQVAVGLVFEAQIFAVLLDLKHDRAVRRNGLVVHDLRRSLVDRRAFRADLLGQNRLGVLVVDHDLVTGLGQLAGGLVGAVVHDQIELLGKQRFVVADGAVAAPVVLVSEPFQIAAARSVLDVDAVFRCSRKHVPCGVHLVERGAGELRVHGELFALAGRERIGAVRVDADRPDVRLGVAGELAVGDGHVGTLVVEARILRGESLHVGGVEDHDRVAIGQAGHDTALADAVERLRKQRLVVADGAVAAPVVLFGEPLQIAAAPGVLDVVAAIRCCRKHVPCGVHLVERGAGELRVHGELLALAGREGVGAVRVDADCPHVCIRPAGQRAARHRDVGALVVEARILGGEGLHVGGVVNDDLLAVLEQCAGRGRGFGFRIGLLAGIHDQIDLLGKQRLVVADGAVAAPVVLLSEPLQIAAAPGVLDVVAALCCRRKDIPCGVRLVERGAGELRVHGELPTLAGRERERAIVIQADRPKVRIRPAGERAVRHRDVRALVVEAAVLGRQCLAVCEVEDHDRVARLHVRRGNKAALTRRLCGIELIQRDRLLILSLVVTESGAIRRCIVVLQRCLIAGDDHIAVGKRNRIELRCVFAVQRVFLGCS